MTRDYAITIKVRNNRFLEHMRLNGYGTGAQLSRASGVSQTMIAAYLGMKRAPILKGRKNFEWSQNALVLSAHLRCLPEDLFPAVHLEKPLRKNAATFTADAVDLDQISASLRSMALPADEKLMLADSKKALDKLLSKLSPRERNVIEARFGLVDKEHTLTDLADEQSVGKERIRQIEQAALRKMRRAAMNDGQLRDTLGVKKPERELYHPSVGRQFPGRVENIDTDQDSDKEFERTLSEWKYDDESRMWSPAPPHDAHVLRALASGTSWQNASVILQQDTYERP